MFKRLYDYGSRYIDYKMGILGAIVMASIVFSINYFGKSEASGNLSGSIFASLKQGTYTFIFGGVIMKGSERLATLIARRNLALIAACLIPSAVSLILTFGVHSLKGTPKPFESTIPTVIFVIPSTAVWGYMRRKKMEKMHKM